MERLAKLVLLSLGAGVVAVVVASLPRHTTASAATTPPKSLGLITLVATGYNAYVVGPFYQYNSVTGQYSTSTYALPAGKSLVVTDIVTSVSQCPAGSFITNSLYTTSSSSIGGAALLYGRPFTVDSTGYGTMADHFTTGFVFTGPIFPGPELASSYTCGSLVMTIEGVEVSGSPTVGPFE
jgi:hypothetical protein